MIENYDGKPRVKKPVFKLGRSTIIKPPLPIDTTTHLVEAGERPISPYMLSKTYRTIGQRLAQYEKNKEEQFVKYVPGYKQKKP